MEHDPWRQWQAFAAPLSAAVGRPATATRSLRRPGCALQSMRPSASPPRRGPILDGAANASAAGGGGGGADLQRLSARTVRRLSAALERRLSAPASDRRLRRRDAGLARARPNPRTSAALAAHGEAWRRIDDAQRRLQRSVVRRAARSCHSICGAASGSRTRPH